MLKTKAHLLVDIDMLFDLRYALMEKMMPDLGVKLLHENKYTSRTSDKLFQEEANIARDVYWHEYEEYFVDHLVNSPITYLMHNIIPLTNDQLDEDKPGIPMLKALTVNVPYGILNDDQRASLQEMLEEHFYGYFDEINISRSPYEKLTMEYMDKRYTDYFCYRWYEWLEHHYDKLDGCLRPSFRFWCPRMLSDKSIPPTLEKAKKFTEISDVFEFFKYLHLPAFNLIWLDAWQTCFFLPARDEHNQEAIK